MAIWLVPRGHLFSCHVQWDIDTCTCRPNTYMSINSDYLYYVYINYVHKLFHVTWLGYLQ